MGAELLFASILAGCDAEPDRRLYACHVAVQLNEVLSASEKFNDEGGLVDKDWIELYNPSNEDVSLAGYVLSRTDYEAEYIFPESMPTDDGAAPTSIAARGYLVLLADTYVDPDSAYLITGWDLNRDGDGVWFRAPTQDNYAVCDEALYPDQHASIAWGRSPDGAAEWCPLTKATPAEENSDCVDANGGRFR